MSDIFFIELLTAQLLSQWNCNNELMQIIKPSLQSASNYLKIFTTDPEFITEMNLAFGNNWSVESASILSAALARQ